MSDDRPPITVLVAGIGGASLGLEMAKALHLAGRYRLIGTDRSATAYGHGEAMFARTAVIDADTDDAYLDALLRIAAEEGVTAVAPGAGATHDLLHRHRGRLTAAGILPMLNGPDVIERCSDKHVAMEALLAAGLPAARVHPLDDPAGPPPWIVKPRHDSGASNLVFLAEDRTELAFFTDYLLRRGVAPVVQDHVPGDELTIGVLSDATGEVLATTALVRSLEQKLSVAQRYGDRVISSGWSQGAIVSWPAVEAQAADVARALGSVWALNVQGRVGADGVLRPFEVNPRHSGTTHLRALAGRNEPDLLLRRCLLGEPVAPPPIRSGTYARAFVEKRVGPA